MHFMVMLTLPDSGGVCRMSSNCFHSAAAAADNEVFARKCRKHIFHLSPKHKRLFVMEVCAARLLLGSVVTHVELSNGFTD